MVGVVFIVFHNVERDYGVIVKLFAFLKFMTVNQLIMKKQNAQHITFDINIYFFSILEQNNAI